MNDIINLKATIPNATARQVFEAWLDSRKHADFTGDQADIQPGVGCSFTISGGYITGKNLELKPYQRIVQAWRTTEFPDDAPDSWLEVLLEDTPAGCVLTLNQKKLPEDQVESYRSGWIEYYFEPLQKYFSK
ncbi:MAG TPA: SRPBCC domain-containing protein [Leptolinea sp.]